MANENQNTTLKIVLVGPNAKRTISFSRKRYNFVHGEMQINARKDDPKYNNLIRFLGKYYNAHIEGSESHKNALAAWAELTGVKNGKTQVSSSKKASTVNPVVDDESVDNSENDSEGTSTNDGDSENASDGDEGISSEVLLVDGLRALDQENDEHWTSTMTPNLKALSELMGRPVTRGEIKEIAPDFKRGSILLDE